MPIATDWFAYNQSYDAQTKRLNRAYVIRCGCCPAIARYPIVDLAEYYAGKVPPLMQKQLRDHFDLFGWIIGWEKGRHLCDDCRRKNRQLPEPKSKAIDAVSAGATVLNAIPLPPPSPSVAPPEKALESFLRCCWDNATDAERLELEDVVVAQSRARAPPPEPSPLEPPEAAQIRALVGAWMAATEEVKNIFLQQFKLEYMPPPRPELEPSRSAVPARTIRKSDFAKQIGVSPATISGYIRLGMPAREDGLLDIDAAHQWVADRWRQRPKHKPWQPSDDDDAPTVSFISLDDDDAIARLSARIRS